ncbi:MAG: nucleotidyl transferase AbiEii/AbiGii toxin family protein [Acidobacteriota bacterium]
MTLDEAKAVLAALSRGDVQFVVIGSMAMAAQGLPRATHDLDLFVSPEIENLEALKRALLAFFEDPSIHEIDPEELAGDYPAVEYTPPHGRYSMDILTRLGDAFSWNDLLEHSDEIELGDLIVRVASPQMLYRMKRDTVRPQDRADAARIREAFDLGDE